MKKRTLSRLLAAFLAVMLLAQSLCLTAFAAETTLEATPEAVTETEPEIEPVNEAVIEEPEVEEPVVEEPEVEEPVVEEPVVEEPEVSAEATQVLIPAGSNAATVNSILAKALLGENAASDTAWEYECIGYDKSKLLQNPAWGPIQGFTSETGRYIKTTYTHAALADNKDGIYKVRAAGTTETFTIHNLPSCKALLH